jgi:hypothetical protein
VTPEEADDHREAARAAWKSIGRQDLIDEHLGESALSRGTLSAIWRQERSAARPAPFPPSR